MKKQDDNPYYDLISLSEWTDDNDKKIVLLSHFPHLADGFSIRGIFEHYYKDAKDKEESLKLYFEGFGLTIKSVKDRMCDYAKQFIV